MERSESLIKKGDNEISCSYIESSNKNMLLFKLENRPTRISWSSSSGYLKAVLKMGRASKKTSIFSMILHIGKASQL